MTDHPVNDDQIPRGTAAGDVIPLPAASTIVLRGEEGFEVLMLRRTEASTFVPGAWIFPGGAVEPEDERIASLLPEHERELGIFRTCALRETLEEAGIWPSELPDTALQRRRASLNGGAPALEALTAEVLPLLPQFVPTSRWITPAGIPKRYDTWFFLLHVGPWAKGTPDLTEATELVWVRPEEALRRHAAGEMPMVFPTVRNLEAITTARTATELLASRAGAEITAMRPVLVHDGATKKIVLPDQP